jgi:hypothetical protein
VRVLLRWSTENRPKSVTNPQVLLDLADGAEWSALGCETTYLSRCSFDRRDNKFPRFMISRTGSSFIGNGRFRKQKPLRDCPRQQVGQRIGQTDPKKSTQICDKPEDAVGRHSSAVGLGWRCIVKCSWLSTRFMISRNDTGKNWTLCSVSAKKPYRDCPHQQVGQRIGQTDPEKQNRAGGTNLRT